MNHERMSAAGASILSTQILDNPRSSIVFAWGNSPKLLYRKVSDMDLDWSEVRAFLGDDYTDRRVGLEMLESDLFSRTNLSNRFHPLDYRDYDSFIEDAGGIDLIILGMGLNGHVLFNEPGTPADSLTRRVTLSGTTVADNQRKYGEPLEQALTMGIESILRSRKILLLISGMEKSEIAREALHGPISDRVPASLLRVHADLTVLADFDPGGDSF